MYTELSLCLNCKLPYVQATNPDSTYEEKYWTPENTN